jgi:hypothetical protein
MSSCFNRLWTIEQHTGVAIPYRCTQQLYRADGWRERPSCALWPRARLAPEEDGAHPLWVGVKTITGMTRSVFRSYSANCGIRSAWVR